MGNGPPQPPASSAPTDKAPRTGDEASPFLQPVTSGGSHTRLESAQPAVEVYEGQLDEEGRPHGVGTILYAEGDSGERARYQGEFQHGKRHGRGSLLWRNGSRYDGGFMEDKLAGQGVLLWAIGLVYRGEWRDNYAHGVGELRFPNGRFYVGEWAGGKRHGHGKLNYGPGDEKNRLEYTGEWQEDVQWGRGAMRWTNNATYDGEWVRGKRHGRGLHTFAYASQPHPVALRASIESADLYRVAESVAHPRLLGTASAIMANGETVCVMARACDTPAMAGLQRGAGSATSGTER